MSKNIISISTEKINDHGQELREKLCNEFPVSAFTTKVQDIIKATHHCLNFPVDFIGASILFAISIAIGNAYKLKVKNTWYEKPVLYIILVGRPGTNKSHPLKFALAPILMHDEKSYRKWKEQMSAYEDDLANGYEPNVKPKYNRILISDITPEAVTEIHSYNRRGLGVYSDELNTWLKNFERYNQGSAMEFWLSIFSGSPITVDRKGKETILISEPAISVCGGIQTAILDDLSKNNKSKNGFIDRLLFAYPEILRKEPWSENELPIGIVDDWSDIINNILNLPTTYDSEGNVVPQEVNFSAKAWEQMKTWQVKNTELINNANNEAIEGVYSKLEIYTLRLALIFEILEFADNFQTVDYKSLPSDKQLKWLYRAASMICHPAQSKLDNAKEIFKQLSEANEQQDLKRVEEIYLRYYKPETPQISVESVESAIKLTEYFRKTAERALSLINDNPVEGLDDRCKAIYVALPKEFETGHAIKVAQSFDYAERSMKDFLKNPKYFLKIMHGKYRKKHEK